MEPNKKVAISKTEPLAYMRCNYVGAIESGRNLSTEDIQRDVERQATAMEANYVVLDTRVAGRAFFCPSVTNRPPGGCEPECILGDFCLNGICVTPSYR